MKNARRLVSFLLTLVMVFTMTTIAFAADATPGSITINGIGTGATYEIYKLLDLESFETTTGKYSYKVTEEWADFFAADAIKEYISIDNNGYVEKWIGDDTGASVAEFAKLALAYAEENSITPLKSSKTEGDFVVNGTTGVFSGLELGYYLIDSDLGALCGLTTTNYHASLNAKNVAPTMDKQVKEDSTDQWSNENSADIDQLVEFRATIYVHAGAQNYVLHDTMSEGLTFEEVTSVFHMTSGDSSGHLVDASMYTVKTGAEATNGCTFDVVFTDEFCNHLKTNDKVVITYTGRLNEKAVIAGEGNLNEAWLEYGEGFDTTHDSTVTYTYGFDLVKTDGQNALIDGATFQLYTASTGGEPLTFVPENASSSVNAIAADFNGPIYRRVYEDVEETIEDLTADLVVEDGIIRVVGLDNGYYYLEETVAPEGYNKLSGRQEIVISGGFLSATFNDNVYSVGSGVQVVNKSGAMLPETGGIGTTMFYVIGGVLFAAAVVLLVTKKRMEITE